MQRQIVHLDLDTFFVSVERLQNSSLNGKPILIGGSSDRGVVASCSYEARAFGVHSAMPMKLARQLCPQAILVRGDMDAYSKYSAMVTEIIEERAPVVEKASIDEHYLDITGMDRFFGSLKWTRELRERIIKETGLPISFGLSVNKTVSKIATGQAKPNGLLSVEQGTEIPFLAPLSIRKIPMVGEKTYIMLRNMGVEKVRTLQEMPMQLMQDVMGQNGTIIWKKAQGIDNTPVEPYSERKSMGSEETFERDTTDMQQLRKTLISMVSNLCFDLRKEQKLTSVITVKIRYSNFDTHTRQLKIPYTSSDAVLTRHALNLFNALYTRRMLIRLVGVKFSGLVQGNYQIDLFSDTIEHISLYQAMDAIRKRYGLSAIKKAISL